MSAESLDARDKRVDAAIFRCHCAHNFGMPAVAIGRELEHRLAIVVPRDRRRRVRICSDEDVGDFHQAGLHALHVVAKARHQDHERAIRQPHDVDFVLADADGFDQ